MADPQDLSGGARSDLNERRVSGELKEEDDRRRYKLHLIVAATLISIVLLLALLQFIFCTEKPDPFIAAILAAGPIILLVTVLRMVAPSNQSHSSADPASGQSSDADNPWHQIASDLVGILRTRWGG